MKNRKPKDDPAAIDPILNDKVTVDQDAPEVQDIVSAGKKNKGRKTLNAVTHKELPAELIKISKAASVVANTPSVAPAGRALAVLPASGNQVRSDLSGDRSGYVAQTTTDRPGTRIGKKTNSTARSIRTIVSEQYASAYKTSKPLSEAGNEVQGANGQPYNPHTHSQKTFGASPLSFDFERSLDFISRDEILHADRQYVAMDGVSLGDTTPYDANGLLTSPSSDGGNPVGEIIPGTYVPRTMTVTIDSDKEVSLSFDEDDITPEVTNSEVLDRASQSAIVNANLTELQRQEMESKASSDDATAYSPLPLAIENPIAALHLFKNIDSMVGSEVLLALRKTQLAHSFILNKTAKDGLRDTVLYEAAAGLTNFRNRSSAYTGMNWRGEANSHGSVAWLLNLNDSLEKYNNKADILLQPRGTQLIVNTALQNLSPFKVRKDFVDLLVNREMFSTIGESYDAFKPIYFTDAEAVSHNILLSDFLDSNGKPRGLSYTYTTMRNQKVTSTVYNPLVAGIYNFLVYNASKIYRNFTADQSGNVSITIPIVHATSALSQWSLLILSALPEIMRARIASFGDLNEYSRNHGYPFSEFIDLSEAVNVPFRNLSFTDMQEPLVARSMDSVHSISWIMPELLAYYETIKPGTETVGASGSFANGYLMPWYSAFGSHTTRGEIAEDSYVMAMPIVRSGVTSGALESLYSTSERELRLSIDMMVDIPRSSSADVHEVNEFKFGYADLGQNFITLRNNNASAFFKYTIGEILSVPRELGLSLVAPRSYLRINDDPQNTTSGYPDVENVRSAITDDFIGAYSYVAWMYSNSAEAAPHMHEEVDIRRGIEEGLRQEYIRMGVSGNGIALSYSVGVPLSASVDFGTAVSGIGATVPLTRHYTQPMVRNIFEPVFRYAADGSPMYQLDGNDEQIVGDRGGKLRASYTPYRFISPALSLWVRIQRMHFVLNPWEATPFSYIYNVMGQEEIDYDVDSDDGKIAFNINPYDYAGLFGLAGFSESDFTEDVYNRSSRKVVEGMGYVSDLFIEDSPLTK